MKRNAWEVAFYAAWWIWMDQTSLAPYVCPPYPVTLTSTLPRLGAAVIELIAAG